MHTSKYLEAKFLCNQCHS